MAHVYGFIMPRIRLKRAVGARRGQVLGLILREGVLVLKILARRGPLHGYGSLSQICRFVKVLKNGSVRSMACAQSRTDKLMKIVLGCFAMPRSLASVRSAALRPSRRSR